MWLGQRGAGLRGGGLVSAPETCHQPRGGGWLQGRCARGGSLSGRDRDPGVGSSVSPISLSCLQDGSVGRRSGGERPAHDAVSLSRALHTKLRSESTLRTDLLGTGRLFSPHRTLCPSPNSSLQIYDGVFEKRVLGVAWEDPDWETGRGGCGSQKLGVPHLASHL